MPKRMPPPVSTAKAEFRPFRCVYTEVGGNSVIIENRPHGQFEVVASRFQNSDEAFAALNGMNRADSICRFCNGKRDADVCADCGMAQ